MAAKSVTFANASYGFRDYELGEFFEASKSAGACVVEIDCGWLIGSKNSISPDATPGEIERVRQLADNAGVDIGILGAGAVLHLEGDQAEAQVETLTKVIDIADALDARLIRVFSEHDFNESQHYVLSADRVTDALYSSLSAALNTLGEYAEQKNVALGIETHGGTSATGQRVKRLLDMVPSSAIGVTYDPANLAYGGEDPYGALLDFQDRVVLTHWKDFSCTDGKKSYQAFGEGQLDLAPIVKALLESYDGHWAIEYEIKENATIETLVDGTRRSVNNLQAVIDQVRSVK